MNLKTFTKLEEIGLLLLAFYLFFHLNYAWWWFPMLFFVPDLSLVCYLVNKKVGAATYNFIHSKALSVTLYLTGSFTQLPALQLAGLVILGHSSFDRALGFELQQMETINS